MAIDVNGLKANRDIVSVIGAYVALKKRGSEYVGLCPFHADKNPSFYVNPIKQFGHCFACDAHHDVISFIQEMEGLDFKAACERLGAKDDWTARAPIAQEAAAADKPQRITSKPPADAPTPNMTIRSLGEPTRIYPIRDVDGSLLAYECRYEQPEGRKEVRIWSWGARGDKPPSWGVGHLNAPRPLYGLERLGADPSAPVLITEGPKKADSGRELLSAYASISWTGGANAWHKHNWELVRGRKVLIFPDNDEPGLKAAEGLAALLTDPRGLACPEVKLVDPNRMPEGWDIADWTGTAEELIAWAKPRARIWTPKAVVAATNAQDAPKTPTTAEIRPPTENAPEPPKRATKPRLVAVGNTALAPAEDAEQLPVAMSEDALADHFAQQHSAKWRFVARWGRWFKWGGDVWREDETQEVFAIARELCRSSVYWPEGKDLSADQKKKISRRAMVGSVRDMAATDRRIAATADQWDADPWLLGVPGGVVDLRTGKLMDGQPDQYITKKCSIAPQKGEHPLFDRVLERASNSDHSMRDYLMRWFGYMLTGDVREECFLFLHGPGGSGKGTLVKCLADILGDYAKTISMEALVESKAQRHPQELAKLARARFVYSSETEEGRRWNESLIKWLTGRDKVTAHFMRENDFEFYPQFKLLIYGNHIPHLKSVGEEMRRRVHLIEYAGSLSETERDTALKDKLIDEYPAILYSMIQGCIQWQDCGLGKPEQVSDATSQYLESEDTLGIWLADNVERDPTSQVQSGEVYRNFKRWAEAAGEYAMSQKRFVQAMRQRGFDAKRTASKRYLTGLKLKDGGGPEYGPPPGRYPDD